MKTMAIFTKGESAMEYYVYALVDPENNTPFYIGKGKDKRIKQHFSDAEKYLGITDIDSSTELEEDDILEFANINKLAKLRELYSEGYRYQDIARIIAKYLDEESAFTIETFLIKSIYGIENLTNMVEGKYPDRFRPHNNWNLLYDFDLLSSGASRTSRIDKLNAMIAERLDKPLKEIERAYPELEFDEPRVLDAGELGIEADIKGARIKVAIRRKNLYCELRSRKKNQRIWLEKHFEMLGKSELLRKDGVFLPNCWKRGNMTNDIEEMKRRVGVMIELVSVNSKSEITEEMAKLLE